MGPGSYFPIIEELGLISFPFKHEVECVRVTPLFQERYFGLFVHSVCAVPSVLVQANFETSILKTLKLIKLCSVGPAINNVCIVKERQDHGLINMQRDLIVQVLFYFT